MSKYSDLCTEYQQALARFNQYTEHCYIFAQEFFSGLKEYLECPDDAISFFAPTDELSISQGCSLKEAMLHNPDGYYSVYFSLTLKDRAAEDVVLVALRIKKAGTHFVARIGLSRKEFEIASKEDLLPAFNYIFNGIISYYQKDGFIKTTPSQIGFAI